MYIEKVPNRNSPPAVLRPDSYREGDQVKKRTLANLSKLPDDIIDNLKLALKGATLSMTESIPNHFEVINGVYVLRTSLESTLMDAATTVKAYKSLSQVEEAFRCYKSIDLKVRPIYHYKGDKLNLPQSLDCCLLPRLNKQFKLRTA